MIFYLLNRFCLSFILGFHDDDRGLELRSKLFDISCIHECPLLDTLADGNCFIYIILNIHQIVVETGLDRLMISCVIKDLGISLRVRIDAES